MLFLEATFLKAFNNELIDKDIIIQTSPLRDQ